MAKYNSLNSLFTSIANAIRTKAKTTEDIAADDFPEKILDIASGTDVSDTTATASDVLDSKYFYTSSGIRTKGGIVPKTDSGNVTLTPTTSEVSKSYPSGYYANAHGAKVSAVSSLAPSASGADITSGTLYKASANGKAVSSLTNITPSESGTALSNGGNYHMNASGYVYNSPAFVKGTFTGSTEFTTILCGFKPTYVLCYSGNGTSNHEATCYWNGETSRMRIGTSTGAITKPAATIEITDHGFRYRSTSGSSYHDKTVRYIACR